MKIKPWEVVCAGYEYFNFRFPASLEKIVCLLRGFEAGARFPEVNLFKGLYFDKGRFFSVYHLLKDANEFGDMGGGHHRILSGRIGKYEVGVNIFEDTEEMPCELVLPDEEEGNLDFSKMFIGSDSKEVDYLSKLGVYEIPDELFSPPRKPNLCNISNFLKENEDVRVGSEMILKELYGVRSAA